MKKLRLIPVILFSFVLISCSAGLQNLTTAKNEVKAYYDSGQYDKDMQNVINDAEKDIEGVEVTPKAAVVFDIDETCLSNYPHIVSMGFGFEESAWAAWVKSAKAPAIKQTKELYDLLVKKGFHIVFITGRGIGDLDPTKKNLASQGYTKYDTLICRNADEEKLTALVYKTAHRKSLTESGKYSIVMDVGDQWSDVDGGYAGIKVKLPNYLYIIK